MKADGTHLKGMLPMNPSDNSLWINVFPIYILKKEWRRLFCFQKIRLNDGIMLKK